MAEILQRSVERVRSRGAAQRDGGHVACALRGDAQRLLAEHGVGLDRDQRLVADLDVAVDGEGDDRRSDLHRDPRRRRAGP